MSLDLSEIANDPDLGCDFTILRTTGEFALGGFDLATPAQIPAFGTIEIADDTALDQIPEADRITGSLICITTTPIYTTEMSTRQISDQINWQGDLYKVQHVGPWKMNGFYAAVLVRITGN